VALVAALARIWAKIREYHPEVPGVVILAAPNPHRATNVLGHFAALRWKAKATNATRLHEVVVVAEHLDRSAEDIAETLIHEAAHAMNFERQIPDCSRSQYHNTKFKEAAETLGLTVARVPHYGFALTRLPDETAKRYWDEIQGLRDVLIHRHRPLSVPTGPSTDDTTNTPDGEDGPRSRHLKATCACPFVIRVSKKTLTSTVIRCESCGDMFDCRSL
jgi:uncharacterized protein with HEPN domain